MEVLVDNKAENRTVGWLRFDEFKEQTTPFQLGQLTKWRSGGTPSKEVSTYWDGDIPWITASSMKDKYLVDSELKISQIGLEKGSKLAFKGSLLILVRGSMLYNKIPIGITGLDVAFNQDVKSISVFDELMLDFLYQWFCAKQNFLLNLVVGTGIGAGKLDTNDLKGLKINLPSLPEQQKIAAFLSAVDQKVLQLTRKKELMQQYKKGVMQQLFKQEIRFKDKHGNVFSEWEEKKLWEIGSTYNGLTGKSAQDFGEGYPYVSYKQIFDSSRIQIDKFDFVKIQPNEKQNTVEYGDIFFTTSSETRLEVGFSSVILDRIDNLYLNSFCFGYRIKYKSELLPEFARYLFRNAELRKKIIRLGQGSTRFNLSKIQMLKLIIELPSVEEQKAIASFLTMLENKIDTTQTQVLETQQFKKGLLQQMFV